MIRMKLFLTAVLLLCCAVTSYSCTLWAFAGNTGQDGHLCLIAKNRDWKPDQKQFLKTVRPKNGYAYLGLFAEGGEEPGIKAGINQKGLVIVSASASSIPKVERKNAAGEKGLMRRILSTYASIDDLLQDRDIFSTARPLFLLITDGRTILCVEIGLNGRYALTGQQDGVIAHTNHFLSPDLLADNRKIGESSKKRLERIQELLHQATAGLTLEDCIRISEDRHDGPRNSILRVGASAGDERTVASWIAAVPQNSPPLVSIRLRNPEESEQEIRLTLDDAFWRRTGSIQK